MKPSTTLQQFFSLSQKKPRIIVHQVFLIDTLSPVDAYRQLRRSGHDVTLLESGVKHQGDGRYSHCCLNPLLEFNSYQQHIELKKTGQPIQYLQQDPVATLKHYQAQMQAITDGPIPGFAGGMVGFVTYDAIRLQEDIPDTNPDHFNLPDLHFIFYRDHITFDHQSGELVIATVVDTTGENLTTLFAACQQRLLQLKRLISQPDTTPQPTTPPPAISDDTIHTDINHNDYCNIVRTAQNHIQRGDAFQIVPSRCFSVACNTDPFNIYQALRHSNPEAYLFYLQYNDCTILGASPEKLVTLNNNTLESCPLAGTRPRSSDHDDQQLAAELQADPKEHAEHMMLVDLARNDLGILAQPGSVQVKKLKVVEKTSHVIHLSSTVTAQLNPDYDALDVLLKCLPAGTLSGAPKIRAMEIIDQLETSRRGIYGGAIAGIDNHGNLVSCIAIRMAVIKDQVATVRAGAGIVYDSVPNTEADETRSKANTVLAAIKVAHQITQPQTAGASS